MLVAAPSAASADCTPQAASNIIATCTGATTNQGGGLPGTSAGTIGYGTGTETGITVGVAAGNTVTGMAWGIYIGDGMVTNSGSITGTVTAGIYAATNATVTNSADGSILGGTYGIVAATGAAAVTNSGSITGASFYGIDAGTDATVTNNAAGTILGVQAGIRANTGAADVTNSGSIIGTTLYGIYAWTNATVTNNAGGSILGGSHGIRAWTGAADVTNSGSITGTDSNTSTGISAATTATVTNTAAGSITGGHTGIMTLLGAAAVTNSGSITGTAGIGISAGTNATVTNNAGGSITGGTWGILASLGAADVTNSGSITGTSLYGIVAWTNATVTNNAGGTILGGESGIRSYNGAANVTNSGSITGTADTGIYARTDATVTNNAGASITGGMYGITAFNGAATVTNSGSITGVAITGIYASTDATVTNNAGSAIAGGQYGINAENGAANVINSGSITGTSYDGIYAWSNATVANNADGTILGNHIGIAVANGAAIVTNSGSITGTFYYGIYGYTGAATVTNNAAGSILGGQYGIISFGTADVTNSGSITGTSSDGIYAWSSATVTNIAGGSITGGTYGISSDAGGSSVFNAGTISGGIAAIRFQGTSNTLTLAPGSVITGNVLGTGSDTFQLGGSGAASFDVSQIGAAAQYQGFGTFNKIGSSVWTLSGTSSFAGPVNVNAGTLSVNGNISSASGVIVNAGGTLGGTGTVGSTTINSGTLAPGNSVGTLTVQGNLVFTAAASYLIEVSPSNADRTNVTGAATLGGATVNASFAAGSYVNRRYTILNATGGVTGTFGALVNTNLPANFVSSLSYDANNAFLNLTLTLPQTAFGTGLSVNQSNVGTTLINVFNTSGSIPLVFGSLTPTGLTQISGETATGIEQATFNVMDRFVNLLTDPFVNGRAGKSSQVSASSYAGEGEPNAYASTRGQDGKGRNASEREAYAAMARKAPIRTIMDEPRWSVWAAGYGGSQTTSGNRMMGSADTTARIYGTAAGADYRLSPDTLIGFALGGAGTNYGLANGLGKGSSEVFQAGIYGRHTIGAAHLAGALAYGWQDVTTDRTVLGIDRLRARFDANALSGRLEGGYRLATPWMGVTPYAAGQFTTFFLPGYAEQVVAGANMFALAYNSKEVTASRSELGVRTDKSFGLNDALLTLRGRAAWAHNFDTDRSISAIFQTLPSSGFVVNGAAQARDAALVSAGAEIKWRNGFALASTFEGEFSRNVESYAGKGAVRYQW